MALVGDERTARTKDFEAIGVPRHYLTRMCEEGLLEKIGWGVYRTAITSPA